MCASPGDRITREFASVRACASPPPGRAAAGLSLALDAGHWPRRRLEAGDPISRSIVHEDIQSFIFRMSLLCQCILPSTALLLASHMSYCARVSPSRSLVGQNRLWPIDGRCQRDHRLCDTRGALAALDPKLRVQLKGFLGHELKVSFLTMSRLATTSTALHACPSPGSRRLAVRATC